MAALIIHLPERRRAPCALADPPPIHTTRGEKVLLDIDIAPRAGVSVRSLRLAVGRYRGRLPADCIFRLTGREWSAMKAQPGAASPPFAFTDEGIAILAAILPARRAAAAAIFMVRSLVRLQIGPRLA